MELPMSPNIAPAAKTAFTLSFTFIFFGCPFIFPFPILLWSLIIYIYHFISFFLRLSFHNYFSDVFAVSFLYYVWIFTFHIFVSHIFLFLLFSDVSVSFLFFLSFIFFNFPECSSSFDSFAVLFFSLFFLFSLTFRSFYCLILCKLEVPQQTLRTVLWSWKHGYLGPEALTERRLRDQGPWTVIIMGLGAYKLSRKLPLLCRNLLRPIVPNY